MKNVLITGGTGLVGVHLTERLKNLGYSVSYLSRRKFHKEDINVYEWDIKKESLEDDAIISADYIIHLTGAGVADARWTSLRKNEIWYSRVNSAKLLREKLKTLDHHVKAVISASAVGIYGDRGEKVITEESKLTNGFLGRLCQKWETEINKITGMAIRTVNIRTGIVLAKNGGALHKMSRPIKMFLGAPLGSGTQYVPWIHIEDLCGIYIKALENEMMINAYNAVSPNPVTNAELTRVIAKTLNRPMLFPNIPASILKIVFGEMSSILLDSANASAEKIIKAGYEFQYPCLEGALNNIFE